MSGFPDTSFLFFKTQGASMRPLYKLFPLLLLVSLNCSARVKVEKKRGYSFGDVLLKPQGPSTVRSRKDVCTKTRLTKKIWLNNPLVSSNMDTVTEWRMAVEMAREGGIGLIHRFNTIEQQAREVEKVKRYCNAIIQDPITIHVDATLEDARAVMKQHNIGGLLVVDDNKKLVGILTTRDIRFLPADSTPVKELMTYADRLIVGEPDVSIHQAKQLMTKHAIEKLPLVIQDGTMAGLITGKDIYHKTQYPNASLDKQGRLLVGAAIGVQANALDRAAALIEAGADVLVIDIAHGDSILEIDVLKALKERFPEAQVIAGNVATAEGARRLIEAGADAIKVGVGPGSICTTRITTGCGYPQLSAIMECAELADEYDVPIIADGGIRVSGDITKAIAGGASTVMLGSLLAGTEESPGVAIVKNGKKYKVIRGMASFGAKLGRDAKTKNDKDAKNFVPEGIEALKPYKGSVTEVIPQLLGGLRSGMSYCNATSIEQLRGNGVFVEISTAGIQESGHHDVQALG